jgi:NADP-dependent 3-hydroxy acid dehydrogenase YdfG
MNKTIVISGASKGIGRAIALKFGVAGWNLALCARSMSQLEVLRDEVAGTGAEVMIYHCDVSQKAEVLAFGRAVTERFGHIDVLVNNAGYFVPGAVHSEADGVLESLIETNLYSAYHLSRAIVPALIAQQSGTIFNICSIASLQAYDNGGSYSISKFAMLGLSKALREELKPHNIRVTAIMPGATLTDSWAGTTLPDTRFIKATDIAQIVWDVTHLSEQTVVEEIVVRPVLGDL